MQQSHEIRSPRRNPSQQNQEMRVLRQKLPRQKQHHQAVGLMTTLAQLRKDLARFASPAKAKISASFFKTGKGEYGEGDVFLGVTMPEVRSVVKKYLHLPLEDIKLLLQSKIHEHRLTGLLLLVEKFKKAGEAGKEKLIEFYLKSTKYVNNWDLVDTSAHQLLGEWLQDKPKEILHKLAKSKSLWERRISIVATYAFIRRRQLEHTLAIAEKLLHDSHDLMHKATGWMLREVGKREQRVLEQFLNRHAKTMPRTMLRYAIERFPEKRRKHWLSR
jgi:3-methyladenine DNA glycosylase AlkD